MGGAIADQFKGIFKLNNSDRKTLIILGISAGFASVFGTPLAGAIFALEVLYFSKINFKSSVLSFLVAYVAYFTVEFWQVKHTHYAIPNIPQLSLQIIPWIIVSEYYFGLTAMLFSRSNPFLGKIICKNNCISALTSFCGWTSFGHCHLLNRNYKIHRFGSSNHCRILLYSKPIL